ncbi:MAG: efflux RND transporter permease subunit [Candidatus Aureabacteria bacterium]|nr:efflux RND transporter permease subunit [Candidatus Auribacterota bacterium]
MVFSEIFIRRPIMTVLVIVSISLFGLSAYFALPISDLPSVDYPVITITVTYPGATPSIMASSCASPLEDECMQIPGLETIISDNTPGVTTITLSFELDKSVDLAAPDVQAAISRAQSNLPSDLPQPPTYEKTNPSDQPIIYILLRSETMTRGDLYDYAHKTIGQRINMIEGISKVDIYGAKRSIRVLVDPDKLAYLGLGFDEVAQALNASTVTIPGGDLNGKYRTFSIEPQGQLTEPAEYDELIVAYRNNAPIRLKDIGECVDSIQNDVINFMYGNKERGIKPGAICVAATRSSGANTVALSKKVRELLDEIEPTLPGALEINVFYDQAVQIKESVEDVKTTIVIALALVVMIIFLFLGRVTDTLVPSMVLPTTLLWTFLVMFAAGFSLDNLSLMALTLSVGFLVDDAIVVLENTVRHIQAGKKPFEAAIKSMKEITGTVISTSFALVTVFIPLVFMSGVVGRNFKEFALTVVFAIICSTIMALTLTPMMCARMLQSANKAKTRLEKFTDNFVGSLINWYISPLKWVLSHRYTALLGGVACLVGIMWLFTVLPKTFMPIGDSGLFFGQMQALLGTSTDEIRSFQDKVNGIISENPAIEDMFTVTGKQTGADQSTGMVVATLKPLSERKPIEQVVQEINKSLRPLSDLGFVYLMPLPSLELSTGAESTATGSQYSYVLSGQNRDEVYEAAINLQDKMEELPYFSGIQSSVKIDLPRLNVHIDRDRASSLGITAADIENTLLYAFAKGKTTLYLTDIDQYWVMLEAIDGFRREPQDLDHIYVRSKTTGKLVPLSVIAEWEQDVSPQNVPHHNQLNAATISYNLAPGVALGDATKAINQFAEKILPPTVMGAMQGQAQEFEEAVKSLTVLMIVAVLIMYVILGILYESYIHPLTVLTTLPPAAFGGLLTLFLFRAELSMYAYIGIFMLLGIVSKNGIMMVDFAKQNMEEENMNAFDAIFNACKTRFRPILMTGASTIIGAMPIALGFGADGAARRPLGLIIVGGLAFAQVVTLFITPGLFLYMQDIQEKFLDRFELSRSDASRKKEEKTLQE